MEQRRIVLELLIRTILHCSLQGNDNFRGIQMFICGPARTQPVEANAVKPCIDA